MYQAIMAMAATALLLTPVSDTVPKLNVEATCRDTGAADKAMGLVLAQSFDKCMSDENAARQQLEPVWTSYSPAVRAQCEGEATTAGEASYVDLLTCLEMTNGSVTASTNSLRIARKKKPAN
jgi:hypothetical protein